MEEKEQLEEEKRSRVRGRWGRGGSMEEEEGG